MMKNFTFYNPTKLIFGKNQINVLGKEISSYGYKKIILIAGGGSIKKNTIYDQVTESLKNSNIEFKECWGVQPNPTLKKVDEIIKIVKDYKPDALLAVGGGSTIDTTKAVSAGFYLDNVWDAYEDWSLVKKALPFFTVLTISATGSEMNMGTVVTNEEEKKKWALVSPLLYSKVSIIDPAVQSSLPWNQTVNGAIDALAHIMENYFLGKDEDTTLSVNEGLMKSIIRSTNILQNGEIYESRANLCLAATLALNGISGMMIDKKWSVHPIEHGLSAIYPKIAHGTGLGILFPAWCDHVYRNNESIFLRWAKEIWYTDSIKDAILKMKTQFKKWGAPTSLKQVGVKEEDFDKIIDAIFKGSKFEGIINFTREDVLTILKNAY